MKARALILLGLFAGCGQAKLQETTGDAGGETQAPAGNAQEAGAAGQAGAGNEAGATDTTSDAAGDAGSMAALPLPALCAKDTQDPPTSLVCTGLYADIATKQIAAGIEAYTPAVPLWSDGADKQRWILLPPGERIDNTDPNEWRFPVGTKVWKEFSRAGQRVETRMWHKTDSDYWVSATYAWNQDESAATRSGGGDIALGSGTYHIPTSDECTDCHRGRTDRILGFDQVLLGLAGAKGFTLERLIAEKRLTNPPKTTPLTIGDDGTGLAAPALAWLHVNCGTTCHNQNSNAKAWSTGLFLRLDPTQLDGRAVNGFDPLTTTIGIAAVTPAWKGQTRITAHDPAHSLLFQLITHRGKSQQMPPIASEVVDQADVPLIEAWITQMPAQADGASGAGGTGGVSATGSGGRGGSGGRAGSEGRAGSGGGGPAGYGGIGVSAGYGGSADNGGAGMGGAGSSGLGAGGAGMGGAGSSGLGAGGAGMGGAGMGGAGADVGGASASGAGMGGDGRGGTAGDAGSE
jgi:hypothetical protein